MKHDKQANDCITEKAKLERQMYTAAMQYNASQVFPYCIARSLAYFQVYNPHNKGGTQAITFR